MLIRRDNKYTLFFRLVQHHDTKDISKMKTWNKRVEAAVIALSNDNSNTGSGNEQYHDHIITDDDTMSVSSEMSSSSTSSRSNGLMSRGRELFRSAGRVRTRRATPTPDMRRKHSYGSSIGGRSISSSSLSSADDGYVRSTPAISSSSKLDKSQIDMNNNNNNNNIGITLNIDKQQHQQQPKGTKMFLAPKDELVEMIRDLKQEKTANENNIGQSHRLPSDLKPNWLPKADIPTSVPILPVEYIHRHRLMKQVVNSLINCSNSTEAESKAHLITSITSRHVDKAGNGKTTLAVAAIQSVEVRERFSDGIAWIQLGRTQLSDNDVRRLYEELYDQVMKCEVNNGEIPSQISRSNDSKDDEEVMNEMIITDSFSRNKRNFEGKDLAGMKEELGRIVSQKNVLICLDDVWRIEDAERFLFDSFHNNATAISTPDTPRATKIALKCPYRILITTRTPGLMGLDQANEVFVRIFSEHEAVKLLLYAAGRRLHGGKSAPAFQQARVIVKGCGNSPLALRLAGGMLRTSNRNWTLTSPAWISLVGQCKASLEEASKIRSFVKSVERIVDMSFMTVSDLKLRASLRRCFVTFAMAFRDNEWTLTGKGIPRGIVKRLFYNVISAEKSRSEVDVFSADIVIDMLEHMNLIYKARHGTTNRMTKLETQSNITSKQGKSLMNGTINFSEDVPNDEAVEDAFVNDDEYDSLHIDHTSYLMHESVSIISSLPLLKIFLLIFLTTTLIISMFLFSIIDKTYCRRNVKKILQFICTIV